MAAPESGEHCVGGYRPLPFWLPSRTPHRLVWPLSLRDSTPQWSTEHARRRLSATIMTCHHKLVSFGTGNNEELSGVKEGGGLSFSSSLGWCTGPRGHSQDPSRHSLLPMTSAFSVRRRSVEVIFMFRRFKWTVKLPITHEVPTRDCRWNWRGEVGSRLRAI